MSNNTDEAENFAWKEQLSSLAKKITTASVKQRIALLRDELQLLVAANPPGDKELIGIILLLKKTVLLYVDRESRAVVLEVLKQLGDQRPETFVKALATVAEPFVESLQPKKITDPRLIPTPMAGRFVLHSWITMGLTVGGKHTMAIGGSEQQQQKEHLLADVAWKRLVELEARLLWGIAPAQPQSDSKSLSMSRTAHRSVWRMLREAPVVIGPMLEVLTGEENEAAAVLLGNVISSAYRDFNHRKLVSDAKEQIVSYIDRILICSKRPVSYSSIADLGCFMQHYVGADFDKNFRGSISKMLVRSPENVVPTCLWLLQGLGKNNADITAMYLEVLADPLGKLLGGSNVEVRKSAAELLMYLANTPSTEALAVEATEKITKPLTLGRYPQPEQRALVYGVLRNVRAGPGNGWSSSIVILTALEKMATKDVQAVDELFMAMGAHVGVVMEHLNATKDSSSAEYESCVTAIEKLVAAAQKGLALPDRSANTRLGWASDALGEPLWTWAEKHDADANAWMSAYVTPVLQTLVAKAQKAANNPLVGSAEAHVGLALALRMQPAMKAAGIDVAGLVKAVCVERSLVLWDKVYHRCTRTSEYVWLLRCAQLLFQSGCDDSRLADLLLWTIRDNKNARRETTQAGISTLEKMSYADAERLWTALGSRIFESMNAADRSDSSSSSSSTSNWANILRAAASGAVNSDGDAAAKGRALVALALACNHPAVGQVAGGSLWILLVQRAGVDPVELYNAHETALLQMVREAMTGSADSAEFAAGARLAQDLVLVGSDRAASLLLDDAYEAIDSATLASIGAEDVEVWQTPPDQLHTDPLANREAAGGASSKKDDAWVEQMQREAAKRKGQAPKLSRVEQELVSAQQAKEHDVRQRVDAASRGLRRGLALVRAVASSSLLVASAQMPALVRAVVGRAVVGGGRGSVALAGDELATTLQAIGDAAEGLELELRAPLAMALLRARGLESAVPSRWMQETMQDMATRLLFRLRMGSAASPLPPAGFAFVLPFVTAVADAGGWGQRTSHGPEEHDEYAQVDPSAEQLAMVADIVATHAPLGHTTQAPRREMAELLIQLMADHPTLLPAARTGLERLAAAMEGSDTPEEYNALLAGLTRPDSAVRAACLAALDYVDLTAVGCVPELWLNTGGADTGDAALEENARLASALWEDNVLQAQTELIAAMVPFLGNDSAELRTCAARALAAAVRDVDEAGAVADALQQLQDAYTHWHISLEPDYDEYGIVVPGTQNRKDPVDARVGVADALCHVAPLLENAEQAQSLVRFLIRGRALGERAEPVRVRMLAAGVQVAESHGARWAGDLLPLLERVLAERDRGTMAQDHVREGVVVLLGRLAQHLPADEAPRVAEAVERLIAALATPSEPVQRAVGQCLPPLARRLDDASHVAAVERLLKDTLDTTNYAKRRGAAFGLAGMLKGRGLGALKSFRVVDRLREACSDSVPTHREGALFAVAALAEAMGRLFEPYAVQMVPLLLTLFADHAVGVRNAASEAARAIMANLSAHGVRLVMPATLQALVDDRWRTKKASVDMLGAMAYCAPRQLSVSLPAVVPRIVDALTDSHAHVAASARAALQRFGDVIHNPELQRLVPELLAALDDPAATDAALRALLFTAFVHYIDAPSLALLIPVLQRAMRARAATTKRNAAQIVGSMAALTEPADLAPYLPDLLPLLRAVLVDPVPETRATSAKALGSLVRSLRESRFPTLVADLIFVLKSEASAVDRAGAAQGLSEVLSAVGLERMEGLLPEVVANCGSSRVAVREGFMLLLVYLPTTFAEEFQPFLPRVLPPVLSGLADENEQVRTAALRAGRILVASFAGTSVDLLIPELLSAMHNGAWRIRQSSIELLAELIFRIAGVSAKHAEREREAARAAFGVVQDSDALDSEGGDVESESGDEDEENDAAIISNLREILSEKIGVERCHQILASLYVARSDVAIMVRQASFSVWKSIVSNTPRTVRECLPSIMDIVLAGLASSEYERRATAARTLGDLVHKLGEAVMSRVVPILKDALRADSSSETGGSIRHGVFIGLAEILSATGKAHIEAYADAIIPLVRRGLCDQDDMVREAAAGAFNGLQQSVGPRVIDSVVPPLLNALTKDSSAAEDNELEGINPEHALEALRELMAVRASVVFPVLIPTLTAVPVSAFNARALSSLIQVSGQALSKRLPQILLALFQSLPVHHAAGDQDAEAALRDTVRAIVAAAAQDENTLDSLMMLFHESVKAGEGSNLDRSPKDASRVAEACFAFGAMCQAFGPNSAARGRSELGSHVVDWLRILISLLASASSLVVEASWSALDALCKTVPKDDYDGYVGPVSRAVQQATESLPHGQKTLPGFNLPKGVGPLLPIYAQGLLAGSPSTKERAVRGMARMVRFTDSAALRPFATGITGPLIRIVGDRHPPVVKAAILSTLGLLLNQIPALMRPFLPQLQRTFVRALFEQDEAVRRRAAAALSALIPLQMRLDPLVSELTAGIKQADEQGMKNAMMRAICAVVKTPNASTLSPASIQSIENAVTGRAEGVETNESASDIRWQALRSQAFGGLCGVVPDDAALRLVTHHAVADPSDPPMVQAAKLRSLAAVLAESPALFAGSSELQGRISESVQQALAPSDNVQQIRAVLPAVHVAKAALLNSSITPPTGAIVAPLLNALIRVVDPATMSSFDSDAQHGALGALKSLAKHRFADIVEPIRDSVVQAAMAHVRDRNITVKLAAERCALYALRLARIPNDSFDGSEAGLESYTENMGGPASEKGKQVLDYYRRVLSKLAESTRELDFASDDEDDPAADHTVKEDDENSDEDA